MLTRILASLALTLACCIDVRAAPSARGLPEDLVVTPVAEPTRINGLAVAISTLVSQQPPEQLCARIARRWARLGDFQVSGCRRSGAWLLVSRRAGMHEQTVQLQASAHGSAGLLSELDLGARPIAPLPPQVPLPAGAQVRTVLQTGGNGERVCHFTVDLRLPPSGAARQLQAGARAQGWQVGQQLGGASSAGAVVVDFQRGAVQARALVRRAAGGSVVVLVERAGLGRLP